ncbi:MAG TPA: T9SS type A sorting domain-containing protein, partial [Flavobacteriales bacterium]|nr:T9SS type A sorting domain-containing protein [Flavobacteriales bacterium]
ELTANGSCGTNTLYANITITDSTNEGNVGVVELENGLLTTIYPNPANENITVDLSLAAPESTSLQLIDATGQILLTKELGRISLAKETINLTTFTNGVYFIRIVHNGKTASRTFLKQ